MPDPIRIDPERLAALIDGRLGAAEAAAVRAELAHADAETLAAYADAVAVADSLSGRDQPADGDGVTSITTARHARRWLTPTLGAIAAGIIAVAVIRTTAHRSTDPVRGLKGGTLAVPEWSAVRSADGPTTDRARAVRTGALLVQYELAARQGDTAASSRAAMIASLLEGVAGGGAAASQWTALAHGAPKHDAGARARDAEMASALVDPDFAALGAWLESARTAAVRGQVGWFAANAGVPPLRAALGKITTPEERDAIAAVERLLERQPLDLAALGAAAEAAERALAR